MESAPVQFEAIGSKEMTNANGNGDRLSRIESILDRLAVQQETTQQLLAETAAIANSNARSVQAWEALIEQNKVEAEEERSQLRVDINELKQANRENIAQHLEFRERFDQVLAEIRRLGGSG